MLRGVSGTRRALVLLQGLVCSFHLTRPAEGTAVPLPQIVAQCSCREYEEGWNARTAKCQVGSDTDCIECPWQEADRYRCASTTVFAGSGVRGFSGDCVGEPGSCPNLRLASFGNPTKLAWDRHTGNIFVADSTNNRIRLIQGLGLEDANATSGYSSASASASSILETSTVTTVVNTAGFLGFTGDAGLASMAQTRYPEGLALDQNGALLFSDFLNQRVRRVTFPVSSIATASTVQSPATADLYTTAAVTASNVYKRRVYDYTSGVIETIVGSGIRGSGCPGGAASCPPLVAALRYPRGIAVDSGNRIYIVDSGNHVVRRVSGPSATAGVYTLFETFVGVGRSPLVGREGLSAVGSTSVMP